MRSPLVATLSFCLGLAAGHPALGDGPTPDQLLREWGPATVLVELTGPAPGANPARVGAGVVVAARGDVVTVLTSARLFEPTPAAVAVIRDPGTATERRYGETIASVRAGTGLALVEVLKVADPPRPLALADLATLVNKSRVRQPVSVLGFPAAGPKLPPVGLARGTAATDGPTPQAATLPLALEGPRDVGFAGGLVVTAEGRAIGLATSAAADGPSDQYIPLDAIVRATTPRLVDPRFAARPPTEGEGDVKGGARGRAVEFRARLDDPLGAARGVGLRVVARGALPGGPARRADGTWDAIALDARPTPLQLADRAVSGRFEVADGGDLDPTFWVQPAFRDNTRGAWNGPAIPYRPGQEGTADDAAATPATVAARPTPKAAAQPKAVAEDEPVGGFAAAKAERPAAAPAAGKGAGAAKSSQRKARDEEPQGGFAELKGSSGAKAREPVATDAALGGEAKTIDGLDVTELDVPAADVLPCLTWSADGKAFFLAEKTGVVRRVRAEGLVEEARLDIKAACSWLALSAEGLLATVEATGEVWALDPATLKFRFKVAVPSADRVVASPASGMAFGVGGRNNDAALSIIDLKRRRIVRQFGPRDIPGGDDGFKHLAITPDGKYLFCQGGVEQLQRYRIKGTTIEPQEASARLAQNGRSIVLSPDGYYVALPSGGGNYDAKPYSTLIFKITDLKKPAITIQSGNYPQTLGFDMKAGLIYAQNRNFPLILFSPGGIKQKESKLGGRAGEDARQFLVYPEGRQVLVLTERRLLAVRVPKEDE